MKRHVFIKIATLFLAIMMLLPLVFSAAAAPNENSVSDAIYRTTHSGRTPSEQAEADEFARLIKLKADITRVDALFKERGPSTKEKLEKTGSIVEELRKQIPWIVDAANGGDFDTASCVDSVVSSVSSIVALCVPYGKFIAPFINIANDIFKMAMGGAAETSELLQVEDRLTQQMDAIQEQLYDVEEEVNELSEQINAQTNEIIDGVTTALDNAEAKRTLNEFMLSSGKYDFGYNEYRNYVYGEQVGNSTANTAYYSLLKQAMVEDASDETVKAYYDQLYTALMNGWGPYRESILGTADAKPIVQAYYDVVCARTDLMANAGTSAEYEALMFAYDLYQTELMVDQLIMACNFYQYSQMCLTGEEVYVYDPYNGGMVSFSQVEAGITDQINTRVEEIEAQLARDVAYILKLDEFYIVEDANGALREVSNNDPNAYGNLLIGETVYLNQVPEAVCEIFGFRATDFSYETSVAENVDGIFEVREGAEHITASLCYRGEAVAELSFSVEDENKYSGGSGTASDPYLIASKEQFLTIGNALDKHYRLVRDIDFAGMTIAPFGEKRSPSGAYSYEDAFTGSIDGNGYQVKNLNIVGHDCAGLFGENRGEIADLTLYNVTVTSQITDVKNSKNSTSSFYVGAFAGKNSGVIKYCTLDSDGSMTSVTGGNAPKYGVFATLTNTVLNRNIYVCVGGIAGGNGNVIACCQVKNVHVSGSGTHNFRGEDTETNKNYVYVGGVCGYNFGEGSLGWCLVQSSTKLSSYAKSIYNPQTTKNPYVTAFVGGIVAVTDSMDALAKMKSEATILYNKAELTCESGWGPNHGNCDDQKNPYVPNKSDSEIAPIKTMENVEAFIESTENSHTVTHTYTGGVYETGTETFKTEGLKIFVDGNEVRYQTIALYGFNAKNETTSTLSQTVYLLFSTEIDGRLVYLLEEIPITIKANAITNREVLHLKDSYRPGTFDDCLTDLVIRYHYTYGTPVDIAITQANLSNVKVFGDINSLGEQNIAISYQGDIIECKIHIVCGHSDDYTTWGDEPTEIVEPTCTELGYATFECPDCGYEKKLYASKKEHTPDYEHRVGGWDATCQSVGNTGKVVCVDCGTVLLDGETIPKKAHAYTYLDENKHRCSVGLHTEYHHYTVTESVQLVTNADGSRSWRIVYTRTCICKTTDGALYSHDDVDETTVVGENLELPTVVVSDGYVLADGEKVVTVYVQLLNNPGVKGANFGIRYPEGLTLLGVEDGTVFAGSLVKDGNDVGYGYNFLRGDSGFFLEDGNLLKLIFRVDDGVALGDTFDVKIVYAIGNGASGGFSTENGKQYFVTRAGVIKVVDHLPGDVNSDGAVDLLDAVEIGRFLVNKTDSINEQYANVDLSTPATEGESPVDVDDVAAILQYIVGGYGTNLLTPDFLIALNTNGAELSFEDLAVNVYGGNNTYEDAGLPVNIVRDGYKFLGWFDKMYGGTRITSGTITYNHDQQKQTLYAQWEINKLVFEPNGATHGEMPDIYYTDEDIPALENTYEKKYNVAFVDNGGHKGDAHESSPSLLTYHFDGWQGSNEEFYANLSEALDALRNEHYGTLTLKAVWTSAPSLEYPDWNIDGYEPITWYVGTNIKTTINPGENDADIHMIGRPDDYGYYSVYAKYNPIKFNIIFDFNGGTGKVMGAPTDNPNTFYNCSIENEFDLRDDLRNIANAGKTLGQWAIYFHTPTSGATADAILGAEDVLSYLSGITQGMNLHAVAQWNTVPIKITYVPGEGTMSSTTASSNTDAIATQALATPTHKTYPDCIDFEGWYLDASCTQPFTDAIKADLKSNPRDITLYAKWSAHKEAYTNINHADLCKGTLNGDGKRVILDFRNYTTTQNINRTIIFENCAGVYVLGNASIKYQNLHIRLQATGNNYKDQILYLSNFKMTGSIAKSGSQALNLTVENRGNSTVVATASNIAINGFTTMNVTGSGTLTVNGANGANGTSGSSFSSNGVDANAGKSGTSGTVGGNGCIGIAVDKLNVEITGTLAVRGGDGGNGGNGGHGAHGKNGASNGASGSTGGAGGNGANGGSGALAVANSTKINVKSGQVFLLAGNGGAGGDGGYGGRGGAGHYGADAHKGGFLGAGWYHGGDGGDGGNGGVGGNGGHGGAGATPALAVKATVADGATLLIFNGNYGTGGNGGNGGYGNQGGLGGSCDGTQIGSGCGNNCTCGGTGGDGGYGGLGGKAGNGSVAGTPGAGGFGGARGGHSYSKKTCNCKGGGADRSKTQAGNKGTGTSYGSVKNKNNGGVVTSTELFESGALDGSGFSKYDNSGKGVTLSVINSKTGNPTGSDYELSVNGKKDACNAQSGGYITSVPCSPNTTYYYVICAKIEKGVPIQMAHNKMGAADWSAKEATWLTSNIGTGEYEWYVGKLVSYPSGIPSGQFQDVGHVYLGVNRDISWNVAYHAIVACPN